MSSHKKTREIHTAISEELQALDGKAIAPPKRPTIRLVRKAVTQILAQIEIIGNSTASQSQIQAAFSDLFTVMWMAKNAALSVAGVPGIISQIELAEYRTQYYTWFGNPDTERSGVFSAPLRAFGERLKSCFEAGWVLEPGRFTTENNQTGEFASFDSVKEPWRKPDKVRITTARASKIDTPSAAQLQAWFDLPSELPQAEGSQAGS